MNQCFAVEGHANRCRYAQGHCGPHSYYDNASALRRWPDMKCARSGCTHDLARDFTTVMERIGAERPEMADALIRANAVSRSADGVLFRLKEGDEVEISRADDAGGIALFGAETWAEVKMRLPDDGVYAMTLEWAVPRAPPRGEAVLRSEVTMTKIIKPTMANERGNGSYTIRVEGDDVELLRDALDRGAVVRLDAPDGHFKVIGCSLPSTEALVPVGFFDVDAVEPEAPGEPAEPTDPGRPRSPRRSVISPK